MNRDPAARPDAAAARRLLSAACDGAEAAADQETPPANGAVQISPVTGSPSAAASAQPSARAQPVGSPSRDSPSRDSPLRDSPPGSPPRPATQR